MLSKKYRIHTQGGFTYIYSNGIRRKGNFGMLAAVLPKEGGKGVFRFGFSIPKKVGDAVHRNTTKRHLTVYADNWIKNSANLEKPSFNSVYHAYKFAETPADLEKEFLEMCESISSELQKRISLSK